MIGRWACEGGRREEFKGRVWRNHEIVKYSRELMINLLYG